MIVVMPTVAAGRPTGPSVNHSVSPLLLVSSYLGRPLEKL